MSPCCRAALACAAFLWPLAAQTTPPSTSAPASAQSAAAAGVAATPLTPAAQVYADYALGKLAELQAENHGGGDAAQEAMKNYAAALKAQPDSAFLQAQMADLLSRLGRSPEAISLLQDALKAHPDSLAANQTLGDIYLRELTHGVPAADRDATFTAAIAQYQRLAALQPRDATSRVILGKLYGAEGQSAQAEQQFRAVLAMAPTNLDALSSLVQALADQGRLDEAQREVAALPAAARSAPVYATLGDAYSQQKHFAEAAAAYQQAVSIAPDEPAYLNALGQALMDGNDYGPALEAYQKLRQLDPQNGRAALRAGQLQMQLGQLDDAATSLKSAAALLGSDDLEVGYAQALLAESEGQDAAAVAALKALVARKTAAPTQSIFLDQLGHLQLRTGDSAGALASYGALAALGRAYTSRARAAEIAVYSSERDYADALELTRAALQDQPDSRSLQITYANLLSASGQPDQALARLTPLMHGDASDWDLFLAEGRIREAARQWPDATADAGRADELAATPHQHAEAALLLGSIQQKQKQYAAAASSYQRALALVPDDADALNALGSAWAEAGIHLPEALRDVQKALTLDAGNPSYLDSLGWVYFKMNNLPAAVSNLQDAATREPHDPDILDHLAQAYDRTGELQKAEANWTQALAALKLGPADGARTAAIQKDLATVRAQLGEPPRL